MILVVWTVVLVGNKLVLHAAQGDMLERHADDLTAVCFIGRLDPELFCVPVKTGTGRRDTINDDVGDEYGNRKKTFFELAESGINQAA